MGLWELRALPACFFSTSRRRRCHGESTVVTAEGGASQAQQQQRKIRHLHWLLSGQETRQWPGTHPSRVPRRGGEAEGLQTPSEDDPTSTSCCHIPSHSTRATGSPGSRRCSELPGSVAVLPHPTAARLCAPQIRQPPSFWGCPGSGHQQPAAGAVLSTSTVPGGGHTCGLVLLDRCPHTGTGLSLWAGSLKGRREIQNQQRTQL